MGGGRTPLYEKVRKKTKTAPMETTNNEKHFKFWQKWRSLFGEEKLRQKNERKFVEKNEMEAEAARHFFADYDSIKFVILSK